MMAMIIKQSDTADRRFCYVTTYDVTSHVTSRLTSRRHVTSRPPAHSRDWTCGAVDPAGGGGVDPVLIQSGSGLRAGRGQNR